MGRGALRRTPFRWYRHAMRMRAIVLVAALLLSACSKSPPLVTRPPTAGRSLVIRNVRVFDAPKAALLDGMRDVLVRGGLVAAIAPIGLAADDVPAIDATLAAFLYAGVTTALDLGGLSPDVFAVRAAIAKHDKLGPRLYAAGP